MLHIFSMNFEHDSVKNPNKPDTPCAEWMENLGNEFYFIWVPQTRTRNYYEVAKGKLCRAQFGSPWIYPCRYVNSPKKECGWNDCLPRSDYHNICEKLVPLPDGVQNYRCYCFAFDTYEEAQELCDKYNTLYAIAEKEEEERYMNSDCIKEQIKIKLPVVVNFFSGIVNPSRDELSIIRNTYDEIEKLKNKKNKK